MKDISRRDFLAGIATLGLAGCSGKPDKTDSSTLKPKKGTLKNESSPQSSDIVVTMDPIYNYQVGQSGCGYITKIKTLVIKLLPIGELMASQRRRMAHCVAL